MSMRPTQLAMCVCMFCMRLEPEGPVFLSLCSLTSVNRTLPPLSFVKHLLFIFLCFTSSFSPVDAHSALTVPVIWKQGVRWRRGRWSSFLPFWIINSFMLQKRTVWQSPLFIYIHTYAAHIATPTGTHEAPPLVLHPAGCTCCSPLCFLGLVSSTESVLTAQTYFCPRPCVCLSSVTNTYSITLLCTF